MKEREEFLKELNELLNKYYADIITDGNHIIIEADDFTVNLCENSYGFNSENLIFK